MLANTVGIIDSDYRGEIILKIYNYGNKRVELKKDERIVQMIIQPYNRVEIEKVESLSETERGTGGFGSTND